MIYFDNWLNKPEERNGEDLLESKKVYPQFDYEKGIVGKNNNICTCFMYTQV